jgi:hypothetical protein
VLSVVGVDPSSAVEAFARLLEGDESLQSAQQRAAETLREQNQSVLVIMDDIDRLQAKELVEILKLVRLVGRLPHVYYLLAYDEETVLDVLGTTSIASDDRQRALAFLEKIVQVRLDLPPLSSAHAGQLADEAIRHILASLSIELSNDEQYRLAQAYQEYLRELLKEPRQVRRFFGQVEALLPLVIGEVDLIDFVLVTALRVFYPSAHREVARSEGELTGTDLRLAILEKKKATEYLSEWRERLLRSGIGEGELAPVMGLLTELFPRVFSTYGTDSAMLAQDRRVGSSEYFERYFHLGIAPDDVSDATVRAALTEVLNGARGEAVHRVIEQLQASPAPVVDKLRRFSTDLGAEAGELLPFAIEIVPLVPDTGFLGRGRPNAEFWLTDLLAVAEPVALEQVFGGHSYSYQELIQISLAVARLKESVGRTEPELSPAQSQWVSLAIEAVVRYLSDARSRDPSEVERLAAFLHLWARLESIDVVKEFLLDTVRVGDWQLGRLVGVFVPIRVGQGGDSLGDVSLEDVNSFIGFDYLTDHFESDVDPDVFDWSDVDDVSFEKRITRAHAVIVRHLRSRAASTSNGE